MLLAWAANAMCCPLGMMDVVGTAVEAGRPRNGWAPLWAASLDPADRAALDPGVPDDLDRHPDVLVIGGGVMGLAAALFCREAGLGRVLLIERDRLAGAASGGAAGMLAPELHQLTDPPAFVALARSSLALYRRLAQEWDDRTLLREAPGLLLVPEGLPAGLRPWPQVELLDADKVAELVPDLVSVPAALLARDQARVHPLCLAAALARRAGSRATGVAMLDLEVAGDRIMRVHTTAGVLHPGVVVFATGLAPAPWVPVPQRLVKGHLVATEPVGFQLRCGVHVRVLASGRSRTGACWPVGPGRRATSHHGSAARWSTRFWAGWASYSRPPERPACATAGAASGRPRPTASPSSTACPAWTMPG